MKFLQPLILRAQSPAAVIVLAGMTTIGAAIYAGKAVTAVPEVTHTNIIQPSRSFADLIESVRPAVVNISARSVQSVSLSPGAQSESNPGHSRKFEFGAHPEMRQFMERFFGEQSPQMRPGPRQSNALGSGFIIDASGLVVTNHHVIKGADEVDVILDDGTTLRASVKGVDPQTDLALLEVTSDKPLPYVNLGDSDTARAGDWVIAIGNPFGLGGTSTSGIVSARGRDLRDGPYVDYIQIDAPINRGNSGGPLFNEAGQVIGINTAIFSPNGGSVGIGFAIPSSQAKLIIEQLEETGSVARAWLGVEIQPVTKGIAEGLGLEDQTGALISKITPNSPAESSGLRAGDVIFQFNGEDIKKMRDLPRLVARASREKNAAVSVWRNGEIIEIQTSLETLETVAQATETKSDEPTEEPLGLYLSERDPKTGDVVGNQTTGVLIQKVDPQGAAARQGLKQGDVILQVGQETVNSPAEAIEQVKRYRSEDKSRPVVLLVERAGNQRFVAVKTG